MTYTLTITYQEQSFEISDETISTLVVIFRAWLTGTMILNDYRWMNIPEVVGEAVQELERDLSWADVNIKAKIRHIGGI